ncbi:hypothetical protein MUN88_00810 [Gracilibacillus caseinilyticus]|uniref:DUF1772 domain-containing protein n=1 Tax=Gracilibacillus caseinilyticus TaxID=2932256 RepID=A0ABY4EWT9_9BACI|nr:hypothetical protein [Gracilibacillus caseinilyticus]UOQ48735.1 hypothetical protein MUN88_00810 [Gracilibacillus caseinilyticus]
MKQLSFLSVASHLWIQWIMLGSILVDTFMLYPNIFHNIPESFEIGLEFMAVASPHTYFPPLGAASIITGVLALIFAWKFRPARYWIFFSMLMIVLEGATSMIFEWPRNHVMFIEGAEVHSVAFLKQTANEFLVVHGFRVAFNVIGSVLMFVGFLKYYKQT